jgi:hypothetical protein
MISIFQIAVNCPPGLTHPLLVENPECARIDALLEKNCQKRLTVVNILQQKRKRSESEETYNIYDKESLKLTRQVADNYNNSCINKYGGFDSLQGGDNTYGCSNENRMQYSSKFFQTCELLEHAVVLDLLETGLYIRPESTSI